MFQKVVLKFYIAPHVFEPYSHRKYLWFLLLFFFIIGYYNFLHQHFLKNFAFKTLLEIGIIFLFNLKSVNGYTSI